MDGEGGRRRWAVAAAGAGAAAAIALVLLRNRSRKPSSSSAEEQKPPVDFASYLVAPVPVVDEAPASSSSSRWDRKRTKAAETSFDSFLKHRAEPDPADFASFLRDGGGGGAAAAAPAAAGSSSPAAAKQHETIPTDRAPVLVLYGTEYGFAREIAEKLADAMKKMDAPPPPPPPASASPAPTTTTTPALPWPCVVDMADASPSLLAAQQAALLVCSTQGDGVPPTEAREFCEWVFAGCKAPPGGEKNDGGDAAAASSPRKTTLAPLRHSVLALGDTTYAHFCRCGKMLDAALAAAGSEALAPRVDVDKEDWKAVDGWIADVLAALPALRLRPLSALGGAAAAVALGGGGGSDAAAAAAPPKKPLAWSKSRPFPARVTVIEPLCRELTPGGGWRAGDKAAVRLELDVAGAGAELEGYAPGDALGIYALNAPDCVAELLHLVASCAVLGGVGVAEGADVEADEEGRKRARRRRRRRRRSVERLAEALAQSRVPTPAWHYAELEPAAGGEARPPVPAPRPVDMPLREALARCYDLRAPKGEPLLRALRDALAASSAGGRGAEEEEEEARRLDALLAGGKAAVDAYLEPRHVIDVLREHPAAAAAALRPPADEEGPGGATASAANPSSAAASAIVAGRVQRALLPHLRQLQPRLYSISSSPLESPGRVQATIAVVRYESLGEERMGVCSTYAAERVVAAVAGRGGKQAAAEAAAAPGTTTTTMRVYIHRNPDFRLPADASTPIIMVGPGTGFAPFRAFILQRLLERQRQKRGGGRGCDDAEPATDADNMVLFFGSRRRDQDYLYGDQLEAWARDGLISLHTAFSREPGKPKVYVQQRLREQAERVWRLLAEKGAHFYVCGDASGMAPAVEQELLRVMREAGGLTETEAAARMEAMAADGRYQRDVWFG